MTKHLITVFDIQIKEAANNQCSLFIDKVIKICVSLNKTCAKFLLR